MDKASRRDAIRDYKERKPRRGVFAVRCSATGEVWVSASPNLEKQQNSTWFGLRLGSHPNRALQDAWKRHGEDTFGFEILAELASDADASAYVVRADLKALEAEWRERLGARAVVG